MAFRFIYELVLRIQLSFKGILLMVNVYKYEIVFGKLCISLVGISVASFEYFL